jgi:hypothetical protein
MRDAFDFTNQEDTFKIIDRVPRQAQILTLMLQHICHCCDFIQSYAKDLQFCMYPLHMSLADVNMRLSGKRTLKHTVSQVDQKIEGFRTNLLDLHKLFMGEAAVVTEITAFQILDDMGVISANVGIISADVRRISSQLDGVATQLKWVSNYASDAGMY